MGLQFTVAAGPTDLLTSRSTQ